MLPILNSRHLSRNAAVVPLRAVLALTVAGLAWGHQLQPLPVLLVAFAGWVAADGACVLAWALPGARHRQRASALVCSGVVGIAVAALALTGAGSSVYRSVWLLACWALAVGVLTAGAVLDSPRRAKWPLAAAGALMLSWAVLLLLWPVAGPATLARWVSAVAVGLGLVNAALFVRLLHR